MNKWLILFWVLILGVSVYFVYSNSMAMTEWGNSQYGMNLLQNKILYTAGLVLSVFGTFNAMNKIRKSI